MDILVDQKYILSTSGWTCSNSFRVYFPLKVTIILIIGNAKRMPDDVRDALKHVVKNEGGLEEEAAESYIKDMDKHGRYQAETWS